MASKNPATWQAPLQQISVSITSRGNGSTGFRVTHRKASKGDAKDVTAVLAEGSWPKDIKSLEDGLRALIHVVIGLERAFLAPKE